MPSYLKIKYHPKTVAKLICQILMSRAPTSHIVPSSAGRIFKDDITTNVID